MKKIIMLFFAIVLSGCGDSSIDLVKNSYMYKDDTLTVGQVFEHREACAKFE